MTHSPLFIESLLPQITSLAQEAGERMLAARRRQNVRTFQKEDASLVSEVDIEVENLIKQELQNILPESVMVGEESYEPSLIPLAQAAEFVWIVDPIDGTNCFLNPHCREYGVGICLLQNGIPRISLFYAPELAINGKKPQGKGCFFKTSGNHVELNGERIHAPVHSRLETLNSYLLLGERFSEDTLEGNLKHDWMQAVKRCELASLARFCMLACGRMEEPEFQFIIFRQPKLWDVLAGADILEKAGGKACYTNGKRIFPFNFGQLLSDRQMPRIATVIGTPRLEGFCLPTVVCKS